MESNDVLPSDGAVVAVNSVQYADDYGMINVPTQETQLGMVGVENGMVPPMEMPTPSAPISGEFDEGVPVVGMQYEQETGVVDLGGGEKSDTDSDEDDRPGASPTIVACLLLPFLLPLICGSAWIIFQFTAIFLLLFIFLMAFIVHILSSGR